MSALYKMVFAGAASAGGGALYIGKNKIVGIDATDARYNGTYTTNPNGTINGSVVLTSAGGVLVTGQPMPVGSQLTISFSNMPADMGHGTPQQVTVGGRPVTVIFTKIDDIP